MLGMAGLLVAIISLDSLALLPVWIISFWWRLAPVAGLGIGTAGVVIGGLFSLRPWMAQPSRSSLQTLSNLVCTGCILTCLFACIAYLGNWSRFTPVIVAAGALVSLYLCYRGPRQNASLETNIAYRRLRSVTSSLLLSLVLVQVACEWSVAAWLPLFLLHRLGSGPLEAILCLAFYFASLLLGRIAIVRLAQRYSSRVLTVSGTMLALAACLVLALSASLVGIGLALFVLGLGLAAPYPLAAKVLNADLPCDPSLYRQALIIAVAGAMASAWLLSFFYQFFGMLAIIFFPAFGCVLVLILELLLMFESHLMGEEARPHSWRPASNGRPY